MLRLISVATLLATFICLSHILAKVPEWTEAENERVRELWESGVLTNDNFQQFLDAIKIEAVHADRIDRAFGHLARRTVQAGHDPFQSCVKP